MWRRRVIQGATVALAIVVVIAMAAVWLWRDRPTLESTGWAFAPPPTENSASVVVTWLGVTTLLFDDGETQVLIDGFFSRPTLADWLFGRPVVNDAATINFAMHEFRMRRLAAIIPVHSHFDHAMDVGAIANRSSASVIGSESTANIARGAGVPEDQIIVVELGQPYEFGDFRVSILRSKHAPIGWRGDPPLPGTIAEPLAIPQPVSAWKEGASYSIVIEHPQGTTLVQGSAGFVVGGLAGVNADVVMLSVGGLTTLDRDYAQQYWQEMVTTTGAKTVYPIHFDDFTRPFGEVVPGPRFLGSIEKTAEWFRDFQETWDSDTNILLPEFGKPIALYASPSTT